MRRFLLVGISIAITAAVLLVVIVYLDSGNSSLSPVIRKTKTAVGLLYRGDTAGLIFTAKRRWRETFPIAHPDIQKIEKVAELKYPWGMDFVPLPQIEHALVTEKHESRLAVIENDKQIGQIPFTIQNRTIVTQNLWKKLAKSSIVSHAGLHGIMFDPDYDNLHNQYIYISGIIKAQDIDEKTCLEHFIAKTRYDYRQRRLIDEPITQRNIIFETSDRESGKCLSAVASFGNRMLFLPDKSLLFSVGYAQNDRGVQNKSLFGGKLIRMDRNGKPVCDQPSARPNPFCDAEDPVSKYIYTLGHKNIQGLTMDMKGNIYSAEHGNWRGDEINRIVPGKNYGYPYLCVMCKPYKIHPFPVSYTEYRKSPTRLNRHLIAEGHTQPDVFVRSLIRPAYAWEGYDYKGSLAPSGMDYFKYPGKYHNNLFVGTMFHQKIERLILTEQGSIVRGRPLYQGKRIRDIRIRDNTTFYALVDRGAGHTLLKFTLKTPPNNQ